MTVEAIPDHAKRSGDLLPAQHTRTRWDKLLRALVGIRGSWADDETIFAFRGAQTTPDYGAFLVPDNGLEALFGSGAAATIRATTTTDFTVEGKLLRIYADPAVQTITASAAVVDALFADQSILEIDPSELDEQIAAVMEAGLAGGRFGLQEIEGILRQLLLLRSLELSAGVQLDLLGDILGLKREGRPDATYRDALRVLSSANLGDGLVEQIITAAAGLTGVIFAQLLQHPPAAFTLHIQGTELDQGLRALLRSMKGGGIGMNITAIGSDNPLVFGPDGGWHRMLSIVGPDYVIEGDVAAFFADAEEIRVFRITTGGVVHETSIVNVFFNGTNTEVEPVSLGSFTPPSGINPLILENVSRGVQDDDGGPYEDAYAITGFTGPDIFRVSGDVRREFDDGGPTAGHVIRVLGSTGDDAVYRVTATSFAAGETSLTVTPTPATGSGDGQLYHVSPAVAASIDPSLVGVDSVHGEYADMFVV